ncbi:MAG TPA: hypothetical protein DCL44_04405 [Elusimicrobia bacterium]|nr:hypothetical protein [Elusimicrobiota bacterium]
MKKFSKGAFVATMALVCYAGFATAQVVSFDNQGGDLNTLVNDLKFGGHGGGPGGGHGGPGGGNHGGPGGGQFNHVNPPAPVPQNHGGNHNGPGPQPGHGNHDGPGHHDGPGPQPGPWHPQPGPQPGPWHPQPGPQPGPWHPQPGPQPGPWHPQPGPQPGPWHPQPGPQPGPWHPHHGGHPDWNNNDWNNNHWNQHGQNHNDWWNNYNNWWSGNNHPYSLYRTVCDITPGISAKGFIVEKTMPFYGTATFYYYDVFGTIIRASNPVNSIYTGGNGTPIFDFYQVPQADHCFMAITR